MIDSIWKTPDQKPDPADEIVFMIGDLPCVGWYFATDDEFLDPSTGNRYAPDEIDRWAIFTDLIAQADKAERLQKGLEDIQNQLEYRACLECKHCNQQLNAIEILKDVEQLIKGEWI